MQNSSDITYFKYPRLGSFYAIPLRVKSYLYDKVLDANLIKSETARKAKEEYEKEWEDR